MFIMLYFIETRVTRRHQHISAASQEVVGKLVNANSDVEAMGKYKDAVKKKYAHEPIVDIKYEVLHFADEIK